MDRAPDSDSGCRGFESLLASFNSYSITITPERRKDLHKRFSQKTAKEPTKSRSVQNILSRLTSNGLIVKLPKKKEDPYSIEYKVPFLLAQQRINEDFISLNVEIMKMKSRLLQKSYLKNCIWLDSNQRCLY